MRVYDLVTSEYSEYKYALTFDELLNREVDISKNIYKQLKYLYINSFLFF